ncbi:hypothetical protein HZH66_011076 [Vespula vulgaris]|uniref:Uncharacterized protein n=1 Tax=Vespula vulgaris TaxID=7454 RepID=A0A834JGE6_VESVU|nr:hypothetical protein HZH66_011076 [Vespula vulgaris]
MGMDAWKDRNGAPFGRDSPSVRRKVRGSNKTRGSFNVSRYFSKVEELFASSPSRVLLAKNFRLTYTPIKWLTSLFEELTSGYFGSKQREISTRECNNR